VLDALQAAGKDPDRLVDFAGKLGVVRDMHLLDIGSGLGGPSRYFAHTLGCTVTGIDLTEVTPEKCRLPLFKTVQRFLDEADYGRSCR